jgi:UbiD family decarboxylase
MFDDLRGLIEALDQRGQLMKVDGADWNLEIGAITCLVAEHRGPGLLFDKIKDHPQGYRVVTGILHTKLGQRIGFGLPENLGNVETVQYWKDKWVKYKPIPPVEVSSGPVLENVLEGDQVDILKFPVPKWHELDGGRYIGTGVVTITKDPDEGWINSGTYRVMVHDKTTLSFYASPGKHAVIMREKYWARGENCPVVMSFGGDPFLFCMGITPLPWGLSEFDMAGHMKGKPIGVVKGKYTGLPIPATSEIVIEGFSPPPSVDSRPEGPFGEWTGYYASGTRNEPVVHIKAIYHRNNPIIHGEPPEKAFINIWFPFYNPAFLWDGLERAGMRGIKGVWVHGPGNRVVAVISIKQDHLGHAKQIGDLAASLLVGGACTGRYVVVVDDDIDPSNLEDVVWAISTRVNPETAIDISRGFLTSPLDPMLAPEKRNAKDFTTAKVIINACRPYHWRDQFPKVNTVSEKLRKRIIAKWGHVIG